MAMLIAKTGYKKVVLKSVLRAKTLFYRFKVLAPFYHRFKVGLCACNPFFIFKTGLGCVYKTPQTVLLTGWYKDRSKANCHKAGSDCVDRTNTSYCCSRSERNKIDNRPTQPTPYASMKLAAFLKKHSSIDVLAFVEVGIHAKTQTAHVYIRLLTTPQTWSEGRKVALKVVSVGTWLNE